VTKRIVIAGAVTAACFMLMVGGVPQMRAQGDAETNYKAKCAGCHGPDGMGATPVGKAVAARDFHSADVTKETDAEMADVIAKGKNKMPKYGDKLKDKEIKDLVAYVRVLSKK
jgi:cytochrome c6